MRTFQLLLGLALVVAAEPVHADVLTVFPSKDNTLYETLDGAVSNAQGQYFFAGRNFSGQFRRSLIGFDIAGAIPAGSTINSASLELFMSKTNAGDQTVSLRRSLAEWGEATSQATGEEGGGAAAVDGDATWIHSVRPLDFWTTAGGDFAGISAQTTVGGVGAYQWTGLEADVQSWLDSPATNFGWFVVGGESTSGTAKRFDTRENSNPSNRPVLTIDYTPGASPFVAFCFGDGGDQVGCTDCPCGNNAPLGGSGGCLNVSTSSATLKASGVPSVSTDSLRFVVSGANPMTLAVLVSGDTQAPSSMSNPCFGMGSGITSTGLSGLRCVLENFVRHGGRTTDALGNTGLTTPGWGTPDGPPVGLLAQGGFTAGQTRHFQVIYRDLPFAACLQNLNTSQGISVTMMP